VATLPDKELLKDLHFPKAGIDLSQAFSRQPNPQISDGEYARSTPVALNVRGFEPATGRLRGGSRPGLSKWIPSLVSGSTFIIQDLNLIVLNGSTTPQGTMAQPSQSGRIVTVCTVVQGNIYTASPGDTVWTVAANKTKNVTPLNYSGIVYSSPNNQKMYYADGVNYTFYDPVANTANTWVAGTTDSLGNPITGSLPVDSQKNTPRLITTWRGRTVLSGLLLDSQNIFFSAISDPNNWDYNTVSATPSQAVALNASPLGLVGDVVTNLIPYTDDVMCIGCDHELWQMSGDPMAGGQLSLVSQTIGMAWGISWCVDPYGNLYFFSNTGGIYIWIPGAAPQRISQPIEQLVNITNTGEYSIRLLWSDRFQGIHVFITYLINQQVNTHLFFEVRTSAWYQDQYANTYNDPICCCTTDGNIGSDRVPLIGSWSGYVYEVDPTSTTDDGTAFTSEVLIGPLLTPTADAMLVKDLQAIMGETSGEVTYQILLGTTAEAALSSSPVMTGTWVAGRNFTIPIRREGYAVYIVLTSTNPWMMEEIKIRMATTGKVRRRGAGQ
jgi:hypothetical protein